MFIAANLTPNYPLAVGGYAFPGYSALYTVILNLIVTVVLTPRPDRRDGRRRLSRLSVRCRSSLERGKLR
jgi:hypothetical protein